MNRSLVRSLGVALVAMATSPAFAHAFLDHAVPAVGSTIHGSPREVKLWFTGNIESAFSTIRVFDVEGKKVDKGDTQVDEADSKALRVTLVPLRPGKYRVSWRALSVDTHVSDGEFSFEVAP